MKINKSTSEALNIWRMGPVNVLKIYMAFFIISFIFSLILYLFNVFTLEELLLFYANIFFMVILFTLLIHFRFKEVYPRYYESIMQYNYYYYMGIVLISISSVILLMVLLNHPELFYLNVLYILLGTLLISFIDKILNKKEEEKKISKKSERIILAAMNDIELNISIVEGNLVALKHVIKHSAPLEINLLNTNFWDLISSNIANIEIENELLKKFSSIKKDVEYINKDISKIKLLMEKGPGIMKHEEETYVKSLFRMVSNLNVKMKQFIKNSKSLKEEAGYLPQ